MKFLLSAATLSTRKIIPPPFEQISYNQLLRGSLTRRSNGKIGTIELNFPWVYPRKDDVIPEGIIPEGGTTDAGETA